MTRYHFWIFLGLIFLLLNVVFVAALRWHAIDLAQTWALLAVVELVTLAVSAVIAMKADHLGYEMETRRIKRRTGLFKR